MAVEYRPLTPEDVEQAAHLEAVAFYGRPSPERVELLRRYFPPQWTVAAFVDGRLVADVRTIPSARRINGGSVPIGAVGPVACLAAYRRQGHVGRLLRLSLERMRDQGQALSGLHTPHDALYARYGWERAEAKVQYACPPQGVVLRLKGSTGTLDTVGPDDWLRLDAVYRTYAQPRNGPLHRVEDWWREMVLRTYDENSQSREREALVWRDERGADEGYVVYENRGMAPEGRWTPQAIWVRDFVSLSGDAYLGLWGHLLTHDLANQIVIEVAPGDPFPDLTEEPSDIRVSRGEGAMLRIVDVERAISLRPYCGTEPASFTMRIADPAAPWNEGVWRLEAADGRMSAERTDGDADVEMSVNTLAPLFTGHIRADVAVGVGLLRLRRPEAVAEIARAFTVTYPPFCNDYY